MADNAVQREVVSELFDLLSKNTFSPGVINGEVNKVAGVSAENDVIIAEHGGAQGANIQAAHKRLYHFENTTDFYNKGMVRAADKEIRNRFSEAGVDLSKPENDMPAARVDQIKKRGDFVVDCRKHIASELRKKDAGLREENVKKHGHSFAPETGEYIGYNPKMEDPIVKRIMNLVEAREEGFVFEGTSGEKAGYIERLARQASFAFAVERLDRLENETEFLGRVMVDSMAEQIWDHLDYAISDSTQTGKAVLDISEVMDERIGVAVRRAIAIVDGEAPAFEDVDDALNGDNTEVVLEPAFA